MTFRGYIGLYCLGCTYRHKSRQMDEIKPFISLPLALFIYLSICFITWIRFGELIFFVLKNIRLEYVRIVTLEWEENYNSRKQIKICIFWSTSYNRIRNQFINVKPNINRIMIIYQNDKHQDEFRPLVSLTRISLNVFKPKYKNIPLEIFIIREFTGFLLINTYLKYSLYRVTHD